jgi:PAS domain S-box-containing protein
LLGAAGLAGLYALSQGNYLFFHCVVEMFAVVVACVVFAIFWNARALQENGFFLFVGIACLFAGIFDLLHALTYQGMSICPGMSGDESIQLKTAGRWVAGSSFLIGPLFLHRRINRTATFLAYCAFLAVVLFLVFTDIFPNSYRQGLGMTLFQQISRGLSGIVFLAAAVLLVYRRGEFDRQVFRFLLASLIASSASELASALSTDFYGLLKVFAHLSEVLSLVLIYKAFVEVGLRNPLNLLFRDLKQREESLRESEQKFRRLYEQAPVGYYSLDMNGCLVEANEACLDILGRTREEVLGRPFAELLVPQGVEQFCQSLAGCQAGGEIQEIEAEIQGKDGSTTVILLDGRIWQDGQENTQKIHCSMRDITRRKRVEQKLQDYSRALEATNTALKQAAELHEEILRKDRLQADLVRAKEVAEAANCAKSQFLANMSHEIRTPLNGILGFAKLLVQGADEGDAAARKEFLEVIHNSGEHLLTLINDILDLSKLESGKIEVECVPCSPHQIIAEAISVLRVRAQEKGVRLENTWIGPVPEEIHSDPARLRQIVMNLVSNAIKFTEVGAVQVLARLVRTEGRQQLAIEVVDTGIGIPADKLEAIFEPFVQADSSVTRRFGGTGLGLAISRRIAAALGGKLTAESQEGAGSTFTATIDTGCLDGVRLLRSPGEVMTSVPRTREPGNSPLQLSPARILLVEDGDTNRKLIELVLRRAGATVLSAENGRLGVEAAARQAFDLILMDMQMPVMDGYTAARLLRDRGTTVPIIALTAHAMRGDEEKCQAAGCSGFLSKPIDPDRLVHAVGEFLAASGGGPRGAEYPPQPSHCEGSPLVSTLPTGDAAFRGIVEEFLLCLPTKLGHMRQAWAGGDFATLTQLAHWLKGAAGTMGFAAFTEPASRLHALAKSGQGEHIEAVLDELIEMGNRATLAPPETAAC